MLLLVRHDHVPPQRLVVEQRVHERLGHFDRFLVGQLALRGRLVGLLHLVADLAAGRPDLVQPALHRAAADVGLVVAGLDDADADAQGLHFDGQRIGEGLDPVLAARVGAEAGKAGNGAGDRPGGDDAALGRDDQRREGPGRAVHALDVHGIDEALVLDRRVGHGPAAADPGIVDHRVQPGALALDQRDGGIDLVLFRDVEAQRGDVLDGAQFREVLVLARTGVHVVARRGERLGEVPADPRAGAGDENGLLLSGVDRRRTREQEAQGDRQGGKMTNGFHETLLGVVWPLSP